MVKVKNKKSRTSEEVHSRKLQNKKVLNPFEVHVNKQKHQVLGRKLKNDRGLPGVSRAKAIKKRKNTLLQEYKVFNKSNKFLDKRIGEKNRVMSEEERVMARYTAERIKAHKKKSLYNLADDEVLTHKGQTISEIEKFDDPRSDDDSDEEQHKSGRLDENFVETAHFGGGLLTKTNKDGTNSHKDLINQLIAESKKRKAEKQKTKEQTLELTEKLDTEWKDLLPLVKENKKAVLDQQPKADDYDKVMRELKFEARGHPTDRLKSEDETAKEEKEKLEKLEKERLERMRGFVNEKKVNQHRSADDLDDNFAYESESEVTLSYDAEGNVIAEPVDIEDNSVAENGKVSDEENSESGSEEEEESDSEDNLSDLKAEETESEDDEVATETAVKSVEEKESESEDNLSDLKAEEIESEDEEVTAETAIKDVEKKTENSSNSHTSEDAENSIKLDLLKRKEIMEKARAELPYTFNLPESYEDLEKLLQKQSPDHQSVIIERMIKCNHPSLAEGNKEGLGLLFAYMLQHINDMADSKDLRNCFQIFNNLVPHLYDLAHLNPQNAHSSVLAVIKEKQNEYRKKPKSYPKVDVLLFLKLVSNLFPTSDFRHQIVTPAIVFVGQMLSRCKVKSRYDITYGLFLVTLVLEYTTLSKRFLPSAINFLTGLLHMAVKKTVRVLKVIPPFKTNSSILVLEDKYVYDDAEPDFMMISSDFTETVIDDDFRVRIMFTTLSLIEEFIGNLKVLPSSVEIFEPVLNFMEVIDFVNYPSRIQELSIKVETILRGEKENKKLEFIVSEKKKPKALRLYEPRVEKIFDGKKHRLTSKEKAEREKLIHKYKKEMKGAVREIRRDNAFLGRIKVQQQIQSDLERKEKVKRIYSEAALQQSELNTLDRKKKRK